MTVRDAIQVLDIEKIRSSLMKKISALTSVLIIFYIVFTSSIYAHDWKSEYEDICSKTSDAMALTEDELKKLIERCDRLKPVIEALEDESTKKVYLKRLQMCRNLYNFCLEQKLIDKK